MDSGILGAMVIGAAVVFAAALLLFGRCRHEFVVFEYQRTLLFKDGRLLKVLQPGKHVYFGRNYSAQSVDIRPVTTPVGNQEILTQDGLSVRITATARYMVADPRLAILGSMSYVTELYLIVQVALRDAVTGLTADQVLEQRDQISTRVTEASAPQFEKIGLKLDAVELRDIGFPGELRKVMAQVALAQKEGLAALERARGEHAALRSLANAAKLLENNPGLLQLRMLQSLSEAKGATIVLNASDRGVTPL